MNSTRKPALSAAMETRALRILLADDHRIFREGLRVLLEKSGYIVESEASDGVEAVRLARELHPDIAILDYGMPGLSGIEAAREINRHSPQTQTILLSTDEDKADTAEALRAGVHGYIYKSQNSEELLNTIAEVTHGDIHFSSLNMAPVELIEPRQHRDLTEREREILLMIAAGHTTRVIGKLLGVSNKTIESHRSSIMRKLNIHRTAGLIRYAIRQHIIAP